MPRGFLGDEVDRSSMGGFVEKGFLRLSPDEMLQELVAQIYETLPFEPGVLTPEIMDRDIEVLTEVLQDDSKEGRILCAMNLCMQLLSEAGAFEVEAMDGEDDTIIAIDNRPPLIRSITSDLAEFLNGEHQKYIDYALPISIPEDLRDLEECDRNA